MNGLRLNKWTKILLILCSAGLLVVLFVPMWRIDLNAPQYPEGLRLLIYPSRLSGDVDIINGLNHYIGMKTLHTNDFREFVILPYIIGFFALALLVAALVGKRKLFYFVSFLFVCFGIVAMVDFWKWEYNYGHHLNPDAAIIVPGMTYQPPLIGFKQLLNFGAYSIPDIGGWIFLGTGVILILLIIREIRYFRKWRTQGKPAAVLASALIIFLCSCNTRTEPIVLGKDQCSFCKMTFIDARFGAEILTQKGKVYKFDDVHCLVSFLESDQANRKNAKEIFFADFSGIHSLIPSEKSFYMKSELFRSPMGGNIAAFSSKDSLDKVLALTKGTILSRGEIIRE
jgi:copper chaperone NosL